MRLRLIDVSCPGTSIVDEASIHKLIMTDTSVYHDHVTPIVESFAAQLDIVQLDLGQGKLLKCFLSVAN